MNNALETGPNDPSVAIGIQPGVLVVAPNLTTKGIDHGTAEDPPSAEGHGAGRPVRENLRARIDDIHQRAMARGRVFAASFPKELDPFFADKVIRGENHETFLFNANTQRRVELRTNGKVRHLNITNTILVKEVDIELIPRSDGGENIPDAP